jgi:hypothetical protein
MGRSVSRPSNAQVIAYAYVEAEPNDFDGEIARQNWDDDTVNLSASLRAVFPSLVPPTRDRWLGREDHVILHNNLAAVTVSEYCGLVAVCLVPERRDAYEPCDDDPLSVRWIASVEARFRKIVAETFGIELAKMGTMSNGEALFNRIGA